MRHQNYAIIVSHNGVSPIRRQAITWTSAALLPIAPLQANLKEIVIMKQWSLFKKMYLDTSSATFGNLVSAQYINDQTVGGPSKGPVPKER